MKFKDMQYKRPDISALLSECDNFAQKIKLAKTKQELLELFLAQDKMFAGYSSSAQLANIHYTQDTRDEYWSGEREFYDENQPNVDQGNITIAKAILENPMHEILQETYGETILPSLKNTVLSADERVLELRKEANALASAYQKLYAAALVDFNGEELTLPALAAYKENPDSQVRRAAYEAEGKYFDAHQAEFDEIYDKMVACRNKQAIILGYNDYSELGYVRMNRIGYGAKEVASYRKQVEEKVVPLVQKLMELRMHRAGITNPTFTDSLIAFADENPTPKGTEKELLELCRQMYHELSDETAEFIDYMLENDLFDVTSRPGKMGGGYQENITEYKAPFIFANWNGTAGDVDVLTHEAGHGFEAYIAMRNPNLPDCLSAPGLESCEIHSMSMEFLTSPWHHLFFGEDTKKYQLSHVEDALFFLPYGCMVDEFQHIIYQNPTLTPAQRNEEWLKLEAKYRPWNNFEDLPFYSRGAGWQRQLHIYVAPFYYIDYCLAQTVALQFFAAHLADKDDAWKRYLALTKRAGLDSYTGLVKAAGFKVPFEEGSLNQIAEDVGAWIISAQ